MVLKENQLLQVVNWLVLNLQSLLHRANHDSVEEHTQKPTADIVSKLQQTGVISVRINRVTTHGATTSYGHEERKSNDLGQLSEKALKGRALSHAVG